MKSRAFSFNPSPTVIFGDIFSTLFDHRDLLDGP